MHGDLPSIRACPEGSQGHWVVGLSLLKLGQSWPNQDELVTLLVSKEAGWSEKMLRREDDGGSVVKY